nr:MAG TPA_asm: hypothetical protein [Caudoviricetes sp.]
MIIYYCAFARLSIVFCTFASFFGVQMQVFMV